MIPALTGILAPHGLATSFESIATVTVGSGGSAGPITFSSIPSTYQHLQIRWMLRSTAAGYTNQSMAFRINSSSSASYTYHALYGDGTNAAATGGGGYTYAYFDSIPGASTSSGIFGSGVIDILDIQNTNKNKTIRSLGGFDSNGAGIVQFDSIAWISTSAITQLDFYPYTGNFAQYSTIALFGVKA